MTCIERGLYNNMNCKRYTKQEIELMRSKIYYEKQVEDEKINMNNSNTKIKLSRVTQRRLEAERRKKLQRARKAKAVVDEHRHLKNLINKQTGEMVVFEEDGYKHSYCPVSDLFDFELVNIFDDTMYCIETNTLPNDGGAMDQTYIFRTAYMTLKIEREVIKHEKEKQAIEEAKRKQQAEQAKSNLVKRGR